MGVADLLPQSNLPISSGLLEKIVQDRLIGLKETVSLCPGCCSYGDGWHGGSLTLTDPAGNQLAYCSPTAEQGQLPAIGFVAPFDPTLTPPPGPPAPVPTMPAEALCAPLTTLTVAAGATGTFTDGR